MGLHKLTAGDGYLYLIRQVAAADGTDRGHASLADYYSSKGETPGRWMGRGLPALGAPISRDRSDPLVRQLWSVPEGSEVTEDQMKALFGEGLHPNADAITGHLTGFGLATAGAIAAARLGRPFRVNTEENAFTRRLRAAYGDYNTTLGQDRNASLDPDIRATIRTHIGRDMFTEHHGRPPADDRELSGFIAQHSRTQTTAVAGYDLTFTPVKSVSALWALAPRSISLAIEDCHHQAVAEAIAFLEDNAAFSRIGADGIAQVNTTGLIAAAFDHRDSRAGDPNLHTHVAVSNKVQAIGADGIPRWLALDGTPLHKAAVAASELYNTRLEAHLITRMGLLFAAAEQSNTTKRPVREIVGVPTELIEQWSSRRSAIEHRVGQLAKGFQTEHGREPTAVEMLAISQQATLQTRHAKHEPRSLAEQRHTWRTEAIEILGGQRQLSALIAEITGHSATIHRRAITEEWVHEQAAAVIDKVAQGRSSWQINHVRAEAQRLLRYTDRHGDPATVNRVVAAALAERSITVSSHADTEMGEPAPLRRRDGASVYTGHDTTVYTSTAVLAAERRILAAAAMRDGRVVDETSIGVALAEQHAQHGVALNDGQISLVRDLATSGARVELALAPAGTGKTTAMAALTAAWKNSGGKVIGVAPTASAAEVLAEDTGLTTDTMAKLVELATRVAAPDDPARRWFTSIDAKTLIIVDEAAMASTFDLDTVIGHALGRGASVRLIGDDQQLTSISAGGVISDLAERHDTATLSTVVRFTDPAQGAASLALHDGDPAGIGYYIDHHRVHVGADQVAADMAYQAWAADIGAGRDSILLAPTNEMVAQLNQRARLDRLTTSGQASATVTLSDGLTASVGDWITTRKNARWLRLPNRAWVKNGHRWVIQSVGDDGSLTVARLRRIATGKTVRLPAKYVTAHTTVGYACTINSAQGVTAGNRDTEGTCHVVGSDRLTRQQLYVALTRGRTENHIYFSTAEADPHRIIAPKATHPPTAVDILTAILRHDGAQVSAHSAIAAETDPVARLHRAAEMYADALSAAAEHHAGTATMAAIDAAAVAIRADLTDAPAWAVLRRNLALLAIDGHDPIAALSAAAATPLGNPIDPAAVLDWRLQAPPGSATERVGALRWLSAIPDALRTHPQWGPYLAKRCELVAELADQIRVATREWTPATAPAWARPVVANQPQLTAEIAVFRAAHNIDPADTRITGPEQHANRSAAVQQLLASRLDAAISRGHERAQRWRALAETINGHITTDPFWPRLATHLDDAARAGADVAQMLTRAVNLHGPLPDELPAAALWWRLGGTLATPTRDQANTRLRPPWTPELHRLLGSRIAETIVADPAWPALVAAVAASGWPPADLLSAATEHLLDIAATQQLRPDEYARLLTYRIELLTHHAATIDPDIPHPAETPTPSATQQHDVTADERQPATDSHHLDEPPPDPYDYPYGYAEDTLGDLDFNDLPLHRPTPAMSGNDVDIGALRARRTAAHRRARRLARAIFQDGGGPAEKAAARDLTELRRRHHQQRPHQQTLTRAHADWVSAEHTAEIHRHLLDQLDAHITTAHQQGDTALATRYRAHRAQLAQRTEDIDAAVTRARERRDTAHSALLAAAGGRENIVTERHIQQRRAQALRADTQALTAARAEALDLDNQLARAETAAARAFATIRPDSGYNLAAELPALGAEIDFLEAAGARSPAAMYASPQEVLAGLDEPSRRAVTHIAASAQAVQVLQLHHGPKPAVLAAIAAAAHHNQRRILALPATTQARDYATTHRYADTTTTPATARANLENGRWNLPLGSLVIVDDADQLPAGQLRYYTEHAAATNTKLLLLTTPANGREPAHMLITVLTENLPWAQQLGTPDPGHQRPATALQRAEQHLATTAADLRSADAVDLLQRREELLGRYRDLTRDISTDHTLSTPRSRDNGLEL